MFRLKELRMENGLKRSEFAKESGLPASTVANYENETRQAPYKLLIAFAEYFNVSVDYLLGKTDDEISPFLQKFEGPLTPAEKKLVTLFRESTPFSQNRILEYAALVKNARLE